MVITWSTSRHVTHLTYHVTSHVTTPPSHHQPRFPPHDHDVISRDFHQGVWRTSVSPLIGSPSQVYVTWLRHHQSYRSNSVVTSHVTSHVTPDACHVTLQGKFEQSRDFFVWLFPISWAFKAITWFVIVQILITWHPKKVTWLCNPILCYHTSPTWLIVTWHSVFQALHVCMYWAVMWLVDKITWLSNPNLNIYFSPTCTLPVTWHLKRTVTCFTSIYLNM